MRWIKETHMKHLKMLGLAATAAAALMAFAAPASANPVLTSPAGTDYTGTLTLTLTGSLIMKAGFAEKTCTESTISGKVETNNTTHASGKITTLNFGNCNHTSVTLSKGSLTFAPGGKVTATGSEFTTEKFGTSCVYGFSAGTALGTLAGGTPASLTISANVPRISGGFLCSNPASTTAKYAVTTPSTLLVD
jgi:hypothetical protein